MPNCITTIRLWLRRSVHLAALYSATNNTLIKLCFFYLLFSCSAEVRSQAFTKGLSINDSGYFEKRGLNVFVFNNRYGLFGDEKASGVEIIHHGIRTATNGDVRLNPTPEQWDSIPQFVRKDVQKQNNSVEAFLKYPSFDFSFHKS